MNFITGVKVKYELHVEHDICEPMLTSATPALMWITNKKFNIQEDIEFVKKWIPQYDIPK